MHLYLSILVCFIVLSKIEAQTKRPRIYYLHVKSDVRYRFATTVVTSKVANSDLTAHESTFDVTLPNEAFISNFTLTVGKEVYVGNVTTKEEAKQVYERDRSQGKSAAHISVKPRETNTFNIQINVAAEQKVTFELHYQEFLQRKLSAYNHVIYIKPGEPVADLSIEVDINESRNITNLRIPPIKSDLFTIKDQKDADAAITITRPSADRAHILFRPTLKTQVELGGSTGLDVQFKVKYDIDRDFDGGDLLMVDGYFVHYFAPSGLPPKPKDVVFILDISGSMGGRKMVQMIEAMNTILSQIQPDDRLNIITFSSGVYSWETSEKLVPANATNIKRATSYVNNTYAGGGTNIDGALRKGVTLLGDRTDDTRAPVLIFLTDGQPSVGQTNPDLILKDVHTFNNESIPIFALAFGRGADYNFIKRLAAQNNGFGRKIYEDSDAALQISDFYSEISAVLLQNVTFNYLPGSVDKTTLTTTVVPHMFEGTEVVVAGKLTSVMTYDIHPNVIATDSNGQVIFDVPSHGVTNLNVTQNTDIYSITEKMWAYLTIKQQIQQMDASTNETEQEDLKQHVVDMALQYNFVTPFTSMVVSLPDKLKSSPVDLLPDTTQSDEMNVLSFQNFPMPASFPVQHGNSVMSKIQSAPSMSRRTSIGSHMIGQAHGAPPAPSFPGLSGLGSGGIRSGSGGNIGSGMSSAGSIGITMSSIRIPMTTLMQQTTTPPLNTAQPQSTTQPHSTTTPHSTTPPSSTTTPHSTTPPSSTTQLPVTTTPHSTTPPSSTTQLPVTTTPHSATPPSSNTQLPVTTTPHSTTPSSSTTQLPVTTTPHSTTPPSSTTQLPVTTTPHSTTPPSSTTQLPVTTTPNSTTPPSSTTQLPVTTTPHSATPPSSNTQLPVTTTPHSTTPSSSTTQLPVTTTPHRNTSPERDYTGYTVVSVRGIDSALCVQNPRQVDVTKPHTLLRDKDTGALVIVGFVHSQNETRIINVTIDANTVTEISPTHITHDGSTQDWNSSTYHTYIQGGHGSGIKLELTSLNNDSLVVALNFTEHVSENIDGLLALPIIGTISNTQNSNLPSDRSTLSLKVQKPGGISEITVPVVFSTTMDCWVVQTELLWNLQPSP
ncbi:inter-alpha-trypsin inhibitor heavy chain H4-like [Argopecten irradians]|uniref:inter-alpha-trypsin inhibitor heavy chain H4-like n=1 Tax=Argopecten irradians TaxID=31199 RepID=UPI003714E163